MGWSIPVTLGSTGRRVAWLFGLIVGFAIIHVALRGRLETTPAYDIVMSYYDEDVDMARETFDYIASQLGSATYRRFLYVKGDVDEPKHIALSGMVDKLIQVDNVGREGETYLNHIVQHYDADMGDWTIFVQPHIAWHWVMKPRLANITQTPNLGFLSFGPYITQTCGKDSSDNLFPRMADIYSAFRNDLCPPFPVLATWAGQFIVSRKRIKENSVEQYKNLLDQFHAPPEHWIWKEGWGNNEPSNPTLGHAVERTWPIIFNCTDAAIAENCGENTGPECACWD